MNATTDSTAQPLRAYLPDFCAASTVFVVVLVGELVAIMLTVASHTPGMFFLDLYKISFFILWFALLGSAMLCRLRDRLEALGPTRPFVVAFGLLLGLTTLLAEVAWRLAAVFSDLYYIADSHAAFVGQTLSIGAIIIGLAMRYLYISSEWRRSIFLEAQSRISALQALIRPHFLFNSMNTIASLTRTDPRQAEEAVEDLSDLLRANLGAGKNRTSIKEELELASIYQRIEKLRLGDRLKVRWDVADLPMRAQIPSLTIQPLLENAIYHGIELLPDGGVVDITGKRDGNYLTIEIENPVAENVARKTDGNQMALANTRQRYELAYGNRARVDITDSGDRYAVSIRFPAEELDT